MVNLNKKFLKSFAIILSFVLVVFLISRQTVSMGTVVLGGVEVQVELAQTAEGQSKGLSGRETIAEGEGMLFIFEQEGRTGFWLKNVRFPLDLIWINKDKKIVDIQPNAHPCQADDCLTYYPHKDASFGLEVNAGFVARHKLRIGDRVDF